MSSAVLRRGLSLAALAVAAVLAGCAANNAEVEAEAARLAAEAEARARMPRPIALNDSVAQAASVYVAFTRDMAAVRGGFDSPEAIQAALRRGAAYDPAQVSRGLVAYASILALQSPEFVAGVGQYSVDPTIREKLIADIVAEPRAASYLPGADVAAGLIISVLDTDIDALSAAADSVENDAYTIQARHDPRRSWAVAHITDREARLASAKALSDQTMLPSAEEAARLFAAGNSGAGLGVSGGRRRAPPYPPAVTQALALAALAALGAAGDNARATTDALQAEPVSQTCLSLSKLNLFQCLAASRPSYEDMFCLGRHIVRDIATCAKGAAMPAAIVTVSDLDVAASEPPRPTIVTAPLDPPPPAQSRPATSATERLNSGTGARPAPED